MPQRKPVLFIPGFPGTELIFKPENRRIFPPALSDLGDPTRKARVLDLLVSNDPGVVPGEPIRDILGIAKQAATLYDLLRSNFGYDTSEFSTDFKHLGWDWRKAIDDPSTMDAVADAINTLFAANNNTRVVVMPHSTGGLVLRAVLEANPTLANKIDHIMALAVPWLGTLAGVHAVAVGESAGFLFWKVTKDEGQRVMSHAQAGYDLFPADPAQTDMTGVNLFIENGQQIAPLQHTSWIPASKAYMLPLAQSANARLGARKSEITLNSVPTPPITNVVGWGFETFGQCDLNAGGALAFSDSPTQLGDGTVPLVSVSWLRGPTVRTMYLPIGVFVVDGFPHNHGHIWDAPPALQLFNEVLRDRPREPFVSAAADHNDAIDPNRDVRIRISASDEKGNPLPNCTVTLKPSNGKITVDMKTSVRADVTVPRLNLHPNVGSDLYRFEIEVTWTGDKKVIPMMIHTS
jgi:pimeloyl-ACP methyl ester carboxylesterase